MGIDMSKELEALQRMRYYNPDPEDFDTYDIEKDYKVIQKALKRNEPMKVKTKRIKVSIDAYRIDDYCPTCDEELFKTDISYCPKCGQKLDWDK